MNPTNSGIPTIKPTMTLKSDDVSSCPEINVLTAQDFKRFVPTGISVQIPLPIAKTGGNALFGVNIDGFIPPFNLAPNAFLQLWKNLYPVRLVNPNSGIIVTQVSTTIPEITNYLSNRVIAGNVGLGVRITSNTSQSGNLLVAQASGVIRQWYSKQQPDRGLYFLNGSVSAQDYSYDAFDLVDLSLNRNFSVTPIRRDPLIKTDLAQKLLTTNLYELDPVTPQSFANIDVRQSQFLEDWLLFDILTSLPDSTTNELHMSFFFDYSTVQFYTPLLPMIPTAPISNAQRIVNVTATVAQTTGNQSNIVFVPNSFSKLEEKKIEVIDEVEKLSISE